MADTHTVVSSCILMHSCGLIDASVDVSNQQQYGDNMVSAYEACQVYCFRRISLIPKSMVHSNHLLELIVKAWANFEISHKILNLLILTLSLPDSPSESSALCVASARFSSESGGSRGWTCTSGSSSPPPFCSCCESPTVCSSWCSPDSPSSGNRGPSSVGSASVIWSASRPWLCPSDRSCSLDRRGSTGESSIVIPENVLPLVDHKMTVMSWLQYMLGGGWRKGELGGGGVIKHWIFHITLCKTSLPRFVESQKKNMESDFWNRRVE